MAEFNEWTPKVQYESTPSIVKVEVCGDEGVQIGRQAVTRIRRPNKVVAFFASGCAFRQTPAYHLQQVFNTSMNSLFWLTGATRNDAETDTKIVNHTTT
jgi:hypothetical protein